MDRSKDISSQLRYAVHTGKIDQVRRIINAHGFTNHALLWSDSFNLLCTAIKHVKTDIAFLLLNHDCRVKSNITDIDNPLHLAIKTEADDILIKELLSRGASKTARDSDGFSSLHLAAKHGRTSIVKLLIQDCDVNVLDDSGKTALQLAVIGRHFETAALLLENSGDPNIKDNVGITAVYRSAMVGDEKIFKLLTNRGAVIDIHMKDGDQTILHRTVDGGHLHIFKYTLQTCDVNKEEFKDLLKLALLKCTVNADEIISCLIDFGFRCSPEDVHDADMVTYIIRRGFAVLFEDLLKFGLDVNMRVPIFDHCSCEYGSVLHEAAYNGRTNFAEQLLARGADIDFIDSLGDSPLNCAIDNTCNNCKTRSDVDEGLQVIKLLLDHGASTTSRNTDGFSSLHDPMKCGMIDLLSTLFDYDANPDDTCRAGAGNTALQHACKEKFAEIVKLFLSNGADITILDDKNRSVFDYVSRKYDYVTDLEPIRVSEEEMMKLLTQHVVKLQMADLMPKKACSKSFLLPPDPEFQEICSRELLNLRNDYFIDPSISFHAILTATQDELVENLTKRMFLNIINTDVLVQYPVYEDLIRGKVKKAARRRQLIDEYSVILFGIFASLPENCVSKILSFLKNQELRCLICLSKLKLTSEEWDRREAFQKEANIRKKENTKKECTCYQK